LNNYLVQYVFLNMFFKSWWLGKEIRMMLDDDKY